MKLSRVCWRLAGRRISRVALCACLCFAVTGLHSQRKESPRSGVSGHDVFSSNCAACHGLDGHGSERAPDIIRRPEVQRYSDAELIRIIEDGVSGTGMPSFRTLGKSRIDAVVHYLRILQGRSTAGPLPGSQERGKALFAGKAECTLCHTIEDAGGVLGSNLRKYAASRSVAEVRDGILSPSGVGKRAHRLITANTRDGQKITGIARNEDNFSVQVQSLDGAIYPLLKSELTDEQASLQVQTDYSSRLSSSELDDLTSYLVSVGRKTPGRRSEGKKSGTQP